MEFIMRLLACFGVSEWDEIQGKTCFVLRDADHTYRKVVGLRPLPTEKGEELMFDSVAADLKKLGVPV
jgi:hypothetical protein